MATYIFNVPDNVTDSKELDQFMHSTESYLNSRWGNVQLEKN